MINREMMNEDKSEHYDDPHYSGYCRECGSYVRTKTIDCGIGAYEFWGARGVHRDLRESCPLCEGDVEEMASIPCHVCLHEGDDLECLKGRTGKFGPEGLDTGDTCSEWEPGRQKF